ncbi:MAG: hypothetical protein IPJ45_10170 [Ignavibacteria bacterium]|nr:hypothetical protein [Ignavibacteria bacterium]
MSSADLGQSWQMQNGFKKSLYSNYFTGANTGYAVGDSGKILKTTDGGNNWLQQISPTRNLLKSVYFVNENTGYAVGDTGIILKTINAGVNWIQQLSGTTNNLNDQVSE